MILSICARFISELQWNSHEIVPSGITLEKPKNPQ